MATRRSYQPRYVLYATAHGRTPFEQSRHDKKAWPGGAGAGFILWMGEQWRDFTAYAIEQGWCPPRTHPWDVTAMVARAHERFDEWLAKRFTRASS